MRSAPPPVAALQRLIMTGGGRQLPPDYSAHNLAELLRLRGADEVVALDLFDPRADLHYDMNLPLPACEYGKYRTLIDIGSLEHVFDTRQCIENCIRMLAVGGWYLLHVPVNGYFGHGLHVFNPQAVIDVLQLNGFTLRHKSYTTARGHRVRRPGGRGDQLLWLAAEKIAEAEHFTPPQQSYWADFHQEKNPRKQKALQDRYWSSVG